MTERAGGTARVGSTPWATVGPYLSIGLHWPDGADLLTGDTASSLTVGGAVYDGSGAPVPDALIEIWQADPAGRFDVDPSFRGFGRCATNDEGRYGFRTLKPGCVPAEGGAVQAPHIDVSVFARGVLQRLVTRIYFPDEAERNSADPVLTTLSQDERRRLTALEAAPGRLEFDIWLQGTDETPFFLL